MFDHAQQLDLRGIVQQQYKYYTKELDHSHQSLSAQHRKLGDIQQKLDERIDRKLTRKEKKKLQWSRALTKKAIEDLESQQAWLHAYLCQCYFVLSIHESNEYSATPALQHFSTMPTPDLYGQQAYACATPPQLDNSGQIRRWDLSISQERRMSSPYGSSTDSGFYEPPTVHRPPFDSGTSTFTSVYPSSSWWSTNATWTPRVSLSEHSSSSERDLVPEMICPPPSATVAEPRKRRYSENAIQLIESRLPATKTHRRGQSVGHISTVFRTGSEDQVTGE